MNKYVEAFEKVKEACASFDTVDELITLKELVDKSKISPENKTSDKLEKALDKACAEIDKHTGSCPLDYYDYEVKRGCEVQCGELENFDCTRCWKEWCLEDEDFK